MIDHVIDLLPHNFLVGKKLNINIFMQRRIYLCTYIHTHTCLYIHSKIHTCTPVQTCLRPTDIRLWCVREYIFILNFILLPSLLSAVFSSSGYLQLISMCLYARFSPSQSCQVTKRGNRIRLKWRFVTVPRDLVIASLRAHTHVHIDIYTACTHAHTYT